MANRDVNLTKRARTARGSRYCPVVLSANGRIKPDTVTVNGRDFTEFSIPETGLRVLSKAIHVPLSVCLHQNGSIPLKLR